MPAKFKSVLGQPFGLWTVIEEKERGTHRRAKCRCTCGQEAMVFVGNLRTGESIGCQLCSLFESAIGKEFGKLTVTAEHERGLHRKVLCDCDCGTKDFLVRLDSLSSGNTKSCGCMKDHELYEFGFIYYLLDLIRKVRYVGQSTRDPQERLLEHVNDYKWNKKKRDWIFSLYPYKPQILVAERNIPIAKLNEREDFHINLCLRRRQPLLNMRLPSKSRLELSNA